VLRTPTHYVETSDVNNRIDRFIIIEPRVTEKYELCFDTVLRKKCLLKILHKGLLKLSYRNKNTVSFRLLQNQIATLKKMEHKNLVKLNEVIMDTNTDKLYLVSDYSPYITLQGMLMRTGRLDIAKAKDYFKQILAALYYCYTAAGVIHRNITLENIVVMEDNDCPKLMELGQAFLIENEDSDTSEEYIAPELKDKSKYKSAQTDVWALGTCLYCMIEGCTPLTSESNQIKTLKQEPKFHYTKDPELQDLLKSMLAKDPSKRIKLKQINVRLNINH